MPKKVKYIVIHCADTYPAQDIGVVEIDRWHRARGWRCCGYHFVIRLDGTIEQGRPLSEDGAHVSGYNYCSIGVCYAGGRGYDNQPCDTRTQAQKLAMESLVRSLCKQYPAAQVVGHNYLDKKKPCPCFDVIAWARLLGLGNPL